MRGGRRRSSGKRPRSPNSSTSCATRSFASMTETETEPDRARQRHTMRVVREWPPSRQTEGRALSPCDNGRRCVRGGRQGWSGKKPRSRNISTSCATRFIPQRVFIKSLCKSQFSHKSVNLFFILVMIKDDLAKFCGNGLLQNDFL